ncbi:hypothetical protein CPB84DRAFT_1690242 [Gymnopilus junonius]|uniref:Uncharacterized protein n=1 Tax=Gymnopilus junonius TaxID=109634 RepID=A0A9P5NB73_GYMJU|nr:hypothetical protein CPB84DRAFT_1690242 [Gymnopilus junonius]
MGETVPEFMPFSSELDWRFAEWAVKDGPGQNAIDRLLAIPGVRFRGPAYGEVLILGISGAGEIRAFLQQYTFTAQEG